MTTLKQKTLYFITSQERAGNRSTIFNRAYYTLPALRDGYRRYVNARKFDLTDVHELAHENLISVNDAQELKHLWVLFDTCNGNYDEPNGDAHCFIFQSRRLAREYRNELRHRHANGENVITVDGPHKYFKV